MKINILGGGPAGLYFAILMKKEFPDYRINIYERGPRDATWGFGVVFSDDTMNGFLEYDAISFQQIVESFEYWDKIKTYVNGQCIVSSGHGFCGMSRLKLLNILHERCDDLGVNLHFETEITDINQISDADLIVGADGISSVVREKYEKEFGTTIEMRKNKFCWLGTTKPLDAFTFIFKETEFGWFWVHAYRYEKNRSTWLVECSEATWRRSGMDKASEEETVIFLENVFAGFLDGHRLLSNRSIWRTFPVVKNARWHHENIIILGDCAHTAHFSIGSGTKMAMEDAIALFESFRYSNEVRKALPAYERTRREETEILQHTANISLKWFEDVERYLIHMNAEQLTFSMLSRSKRVTYDNLGLRDPGYIADVDHWFACLAKKNTDLEIDTENPVVPIFQPVKIGNLLIPNRIALSPMCQYSAEDGTITDWHYVHYCSHALGGVGLVLTEMICISPEARITPGCAGIYNREHISAWKRIVEFIHANSQAKVCAQLGHAGRKGATKLAWEGMDQPLEERPWEIISASPIPYLENSAIPREASKADMDEVREQYAQCAKNAAACGFDMLEIHMAHGYLLSGYISPVTNKRVDEYGGNIDNRMRFPLQCLAAVREVWPDDKPISVRISACDWVEDGLTTDEMLSVARLLKENGVDVINVSTGQVTRNEQPQYGRMYQAPFSDQIRNEVGITTIVAGNIANADQANTLIAAGRTDIVAFARPLLVNPNMMLEAAAKYRHTEQYWPKQYLAGKFHAELTAEKQNEEIKELKKLAKPPLPADALALARGRYELGMKN